MPNLSLGQRNLQAEAMDAPNLPREEHEQALRGLARLNRCSGVAYAMYRRLKRIALTRANQSLHLVDVASGAGDIPVQLSLIHI